MADKTVTLHQPLAGQPDAGSSVSLVDTYADWLVENGYATAEGGNASSFDGAMATSVVAASDPTLAANREAAGALAALIAEAAQKRVEKAGAGDTVRKTRGQNPAANSAGVSDSAAVVKTP
jgi:hypothetical protein